MEASNNTNSIIILMVIACMHSLIYKLSTLCIIMILKSLKVSGYYQIIKRLHTKGQSVKCYRLSKVCKHESVSQLPYIII